MFSSGLYYFLNSSFGSDASGVFAFFSDFSDSGFNHFINKLPPNNTYFSGDFSNFYLKNGSGGALFNNNKILFTPPLNYYNQFNGTSLFFCYEKTGLDGGVIFSNLHSGNTSEYPSGFSIGITKTNRLYFEYYNNYINKIISFTVPKILGSKNLFYVTLFETNVFFGIFERNLQNSFFESFSFVFPRGGPELSNSFCLGGIPDSNILSGSQTGNFLGIIEGFGISSFGFSDLCFSNFCSGYLFDIENLGEIRYEEIVQITGYEETIVPIFSGITGYEVVFTGEVEDDFGNVYSGAKTVELSGVIYGTGYAQLTGTVLVPVFEEDQFSLKINKEKFNSFGYDGAVILTEFNDSDILSLLYSSGSINLEDSLSGFFYNISNNKIIYDRVSNYLGFDLFYNTGENFPFLYVNGVFQKTGEIQGNKFKGFEVSFGDYVLSGLNLIPNKKYSDSDFFLSDISRNETFSLEIINNFSHKSGTGNCFILASSDLKNNTNSFFFFNGQKLTEGIDYFLDDSGYYFSNNFSLFDGIEGDLQIIKNVDGIIEAISSGNSVFSKNKFSFKKSSFYLNGIRLNFGNDYIYVSRTDLLTGKSSKIYNLKPLFSNSSLFFNSLN